MARYLFVPYSVSGHVNPMLPVLAELAGRGAVVRVLVTERYAAAVRSAGAVPVVLTAVLDVCVPERWWDRLEPRRVVGRLRRVVVNWRAGAQLREELRTWPPDVVVIDPMLGWADRATRRCGARTVVFSTTFASNPAVAAAVAREHGAVFGRWWARWSSPLVGWSPVARRWRPDRLVLANTIGVLQPMPDAFGGGLHVVGPAIRRVEPDAELLGQLDPSRPVLLVSPGTVFARGAGFFNAVVAAFGDTDWTVVVATGPTDPSTLRPWPSNVLVQRSVPQVPLLARCAVFLTHAGMNSVLEALTVGVPMAMAPRSVEQRHIAGRVAALGVGVPVDVQGWAPQRLAASVTALAHDPSVRSAVRSWRIRLAAAHGPQLAADLLVGAAIGATVRGSTSRSGRLFRVGGVVRGGIGVGDADAVAPGDGEVVDGLGEPPSSGGEPPV